MSDKLLALSGLGGGCVNLVLGDSVHEHHIGAEKCYTFDPPASYSGMWQTGFETNLFAIGTTSSTPLHNSPTTFRLAGSLPFEKLRCRMDRDACFFQLSFIGRKSRFPVRLGQHIIVVDRLTMFRPVIAARKRFGNQGVFWVSPEDSSD